MLQSEFINDLTETKSLFNKYTLMDEVNNEDININKLYIEFIKFRNSIKLMTSKEYGKKYSRLEFDEDIEEFTLYDYNGCFIEWNEVPNKYYVPLYNSGFEGTLKECEIYLFILFYMYECIETDKIKNK
tara:strand:+ start:685 stop:1071 length:387 start_codon:yes stop_codon:yes gene_type:complete